MKTLTENNTAAGTAYVDCGNGEPLVLIHGVGLNRQVWQSQLEAFSDDYRVIAYDTLGHGNSRIPAADVVLDDYFEQLAELLDTLEIDSVDLCGHSMGALITLGFNFRMNIGLKYACYQVLSRFGNLKSLRCQLINLAIFNLHLCCCHCRRFPVA